NIHLITDALREKFNLDNPQVEVTEVDNPELDARIMAFRLASSLERGRHFRRSAHGIIRRILASGAKGVEIKISGKVTSQRARVETFRAGFVAKAGDPAMTFVDVGKATAIIRRGLIGVRINIMRGDAILPDDIAIVAEPTSTSMIVDTGAEVEPEITEEISEEAIEELDEYPEIEEEIIAEIKKKEKIKSDDEFSELDEVDKKAKSRSKVKGKDKTKDESDKKTKESDKKTKGKDKTKDESDKKTKGKDKTKDESDKKAKDKKTKKKKEE
ncbi:MAG: 30S ribosomal protein S3, partial [Candidatus Heimdallarchaeaceae archaeon]